MSLLKLLRGSLVAVCFFVVNANAAEIVDCKVEFSTTGSPVLVAIDGKSDAPCVGQIVDSAGDISQSKITLDLSKLDTGIGLRNKHLKENYLHIDKFPTATLSNVRAQDFGAQVKGKGDDSSFVANLDLHGVQKDVKGTYRIKNGNAFKAKFEIEVTDFNIQRPDFMGVKVVDKVHVTVNFKTK